MCVTILIRMTHSNGEFKLDGQLRFIHGTVVHQMPL